MLALVALVAVSAGAAYYAHLTYLPDPLEASDHDLFRWLVMRDVREEAPEAQSKLLCRIEIYLDQNQEAFDASDALAELSEAQHEQFENNCHALLEVWLVEKSDFYFTLAEEDRAAFLDRQTKCIQRWASQGWLGNNTEGQPQSVMAAAQGLMKRISPWIERQDKTRQNRTRQFLSAMALRWMVRSYS